MDCPSPALTSVAYFCSPFSFSPINSCSINKQCNIQPSRLLCAFMCSFLTMLRRLFQGNRRDGHDSREPRQVQVPAKSTHVTPPSTATGKNKNKYNEDLDPHGAPLTPPPTEQTEERTGHGLREPRQIQVQVPAENPFRWRPLPRRLGTTPLEIFY